MIELKLQCGFNNILELKKYMISKGEDFNDYDYVLIVTDREEMCEEYDLKNANNIFFTTTFDKYDIQKGLELVKFICATKTREDTSAKLLASKVLLYTQIKTADNLYIDRLSDWPSLQWEHEVTMSYDEGDLSAYIQNQYSNKIDMKNLSKQTKDGIIDIACMISGEEKARMQKAVKNIEKLARFS